MWIKSKFLTQSLYSTIYLKKKYKKYYRFNLKKKKLIVLLPKISFSVILINKVSVMFFENFFNKFHNRLKRDIKKFYIETKFIYFPFRQVHLKTRKAKDIRMGRGKGNPILHVTFSKKTKPFFCFWAVQDLNFFYFIYKIRKILPISILYVFKYLF